jgi:hypothetical protein
VNAIEVYWTLPYAIPDDRTYADIVCNTQGKASPADAGEQLTTDPLRIFQSSMMAEKWGLGNCFYLGVAKDANPYFKHRFQCRDIGALAKDAVVKLAFQYSLSNTQKAYTAGAWSGTNNYVVQKATTLDCEVKINTYTSATSSAVNWYQSKGSWKIDGHSQASRNGRFQTFLVTRAGQPGIGMLGAATVFERSKDNVPMTVWLFLTFYDYAGAFGSGLEKRRVFPFDCQGTSGKTTLDLFFRAYGKDVKSAATLTVSIGDNT